MLESTTDRYGETVRVGAFVTAHSLAFEIYDLWVVSKINNDGTVELTQHKGISYSKIHPDEIVRQ